MPEEKTIQIGRELHCPSCDALVLKREVKCPVCGAALGAEGGMAASRLSDEELGKKLRARRMGRIIARVLVAPLIIAVIVTFFAAMIEGEALYWVLMVAAAAGAVYCLLYKFGSKYSLKQLVSVNIVQDALAEVFEGCTYRFDDRLAGSVVEEARLITGWNEISGSDLVGGKYRGHGVELSDIKLVKVTQGIEINGHSREKRETLFQGQWLVFELGRELPAAVRVIEKAGRAGLTSTLKRIAAKGDVETENAAFNQQFRIETDDPHTAFYILTPHFLEHIMAADAAARARTCLCFTGSQVHIALDNGLDLFEIGKRADVKDIAALRARMKSQIRYLTGILDALMQNDYLFGKEN